MYRKANKHGSCGLRFTQPTKCQAHLAKMCDVNYMIARAVQGDASVYRRGFNADVSRMPEDMQGYMNAIVRGREAYEALPAAVRSVYPSAEVFMAALSNPDEKNRLVKLGVFSEVKPEEPLPVRVIPEGNEPPKGEAQS